jgi:hypothetical protein
VEETPIAPIAPTPMMPTSATAIGSNTFVITERSDSSRLGRAIAVAVAVVAVVMKDHPDCRYPVSD